MAVIDLKNWRFNPFTNVTHDATITDELHTIQYHDDWNAYGIQTNEMPFFENPSSLSIRKVSDSSLFTEVPRSQAPQPGEYRVDYDGETYFGTGRCEFNIGDNGTDVKVTYQGTGSVIKNRNTLGATTFPADVVVDGETTLNDAVLIDSTLNVTGKTTVDDMDATGTVVFTGAPTINAEPSAATDATRKSYVDGLVFSGIISLWGGISVPTGWLLCNGQSVDRATYSSLFAAISLSKGICTISIASPGVVTFNDHGLITGDCISITTTGALPTGLTASTNYYVIYNDANSFWLATTYANALASTKINTSGAQNGDHTLRYNPYKIDGANNFLVPDFRGISPAGNGTQGTAAWSAAEYLTGLGHYQQDRFQMWQVGSTADSTGARNYYSVVYDRDYVNSQSGAANYGAMVARTTYQGVTNMLKGVNDGTNGEPRTGKNTRTAQIGINFIIKT